MLARTVHISRIPGHQNWVEIFPGSQDTKITGVPLFPGFGDTRITGGPLFPGSPEAKIDPFPIFPGSPEIKIGGFPRFPGSPEIKNDRFQKKHILLIYLNWISNKHIIFFIEILNK